ncbi:MAG TPA: hypothetical protein VF189_04380 [Patescibacteria group bacterium]
MSGEPEFSFKSLFVPFTKIKAVLWIGFVGYLVFFNMLLNGFVEDDKKYIIDYPLVHTVNLIATFGINNFNIAGQYRPIPATYFSILYFLFGNISFFYHVLQLSLHISVAILVYLLFCKFLSKKISFFASLIFLVHPIQVESVSYIAQTVSPLFSLFGLIPLLILTKKVVSIKELFISYFLLLLALLTKETGIIFLFLILLYSFLFIKKSLLKYIFFSLGVISIYGFIRIGIGHVGLSTRLLPPIASLPLATRIINIPAIVFYYVRTLIFPSTLAFDQQWTVTTINFSNFYFPFIIDVIFFSIIIIFGFFLFKKSKKFFKIYLFFFSWFLSSLFFHVQIFPLDATVGDRWFYLTMIGIIGLLAIIYQSFELYLNKSVRRIIFISICVVILLLSVRTIYRNSNWVDPITLYTHDILISDDYDLENSLGTEYLEKKDYTRALDHFNKSAILRPNEFNLHNLGVTYEDMGSMEKAKEYFESALSAKDYKAFLPHKHDENSYKSYASILIYFEDYNKANEFIHNALIDYPDSSDLWMFFSLTQLKLHDENGALSSAEKAYTIDSNSTDTYIYQHVTQNQPFTINLYGKTLDF